MSKTGGDSQPSTGQSCPACSGDAQASQLQSRVQQQSKMIQELEERNRELRLLLHHSQKDLLMARRSIWLLQKALKRLGDSTPSDNDEPQSAQSNMRPSGQTSTTEALISMPTKEP